MKMYTEIYHGRKETQEGIYAKVKQQKVVDKFFILCFLLISSFFYAPLKAQEYSTIIKELKLGNLESVTQIVEKGNQDKAVKSFLLIYLDYLKKGDYKLKSFPTELKARSVLPDTYRAMYYYMYGDIVKEEYKDSVFFYPFYLKALDLAEKGHNSILKNEVLKRLLHHFQRNPLNIELYEEYKNQFLKEAKDSTDILWSKYYAISYKVHKECLRKEMYDDEVKTKDFTTAIKKINFKNILNAKAAKKNLFFKARVLQMFGIYQDVLIKEPDSAKISFEKAKQYFENNPYYFSQKEAVRANINKGYALKLNGNYNEAIAILKKSIEAKSSKSNLTQKRVMYKQLSDCYDSLQKMDSAKYFLDKKIYVDNLTKKHQRAERIYSLDLSSRIENVKQEKEKLNKNNQMLFTGLIIVLILTGFIYYNWNLSKKKKKDLEVQHEQVIEEIKSIKKLVIQDRIVLKNKVHILLEELIYIKSEDHYLALYTLDKKEFIRGKISEIIKELPPNFVKSHRSYIINKNFVDYVNSKEIRLKNNKFIPLSRTYKDNFS